MCCTCQLFCISIPIKKFTQEQTKSYSLGIRIETVKMEKRKWRKTY